MIDENGFRLNVGIILTNSFGKVFWGHRIGKKNIWQFPQGGIQDNETPENAMYRELYEEIGLVKSDVKILAGTQQWFHYCLPGYLQKTHKKPLCIGQKQKWFLLQLIADEKKICFNCTNKPEFTTWRWIDYWEPPKKIVYFKKKVYQDVLTELEPFLC